MKMRKLLIFTASIFAITGLCGCSGDDDSPETPYLPEDIPTQSVLYLNPVKASLPGVYSFAELNSQYAELFAPMQSNTITIERTDGGSLADVRFSIPGGFQGNEPGLDDEGKYAIDDAFEVTLTNDYTLQIKMAEYPEGPSRIYSFYILIPDITPDKAYANNKIYLLPKDYWKSHPSADEYQRMIIGIGQFQIEYLPDPMIGKFGCHITLGN